MAENKGQRCLVRITDSNAADAPTATLAPSAGLSLSPLFEVADPAPGLGAVPSGATWHIAQFDEAREANAWDAAHSLIDPIRGLGMAGVQFVEPDRYQAIEPRPPTEGPSFAAADPGCSLTPQDPRLPGGGGFAWHLRDDYTQLAAARRRAGGGRGARIAHLDTGYDPDHLARPRHLDLRAQRNFTGEGPDDAIDRTPFSPFTNRGHGPATLALLAGGATDAARAADPPDGADIGGAPDAAVIPVRVADAVAHFWTSAIAQGIAYAADQKVDVLSLSMGGVASFVWADAVNKAYEAGVTLVAAAGNNYAQLPTRHIVYPARFGRVIAACGIMADHRAYQNQPATIMQGNFGPASKMRTALSAFSPNVPWARLGCGDVFAMNGSGTSSATPQIAAAAALWIDHHRAALNAYPERWMRVEAVRHALFSSAEQPLNSMSPEEISQMLGAGVLQANDALAVAALQASQLVRTPADNAIFAFLRILTGLGVGTGGPRADMLRLEMTQLAQTSRLIEDVVGDPDLEPEAIGESDRRRFTEAVIADPRASGTLRAFLEGKSGHRPPRKAPNAAAGPVGKPLVERRMVRTPPTERRLRIFASDPSLSGIHETAPLSKVTVAVPWEGARQGSVGLQPGPVGEYLEVVDIDPASGCGYAPVDLDDPYLLADSGLEPSESNPQFHQQMVYAVAMTTIGHFERALGRVALWAPERRKWTRKDGIVAYEDIPTRRLRIYPHALREANAYYSPTKKALLFGYFSAAPLARGGTVPGSTVFTCLSHDIIAHETTHALLDGLHRRYQEATNPDMPAFHEAFADIVAIMQHFSLPGLLEHELQRTGGDLAKGENLAALARQFGQGIGRSAALRSAIGLDEALDYRQIDEPHGRGSILVAAVFAAFLSIYKRRAADLLRLAADGPSVLRPASMHPDLLARLAGEARKAATHVLRMCIRALDYCPPVDLTFGDYLRAVITADADLVPDDPFDYRVAFLEAFRNRGIYPDDLRTVSVDSLRWQEPTLPLEGLADILRQMDLSWDLEADRTRAASLRQSNGGAFHDWLRARLTPELAAQLGLDMTLTPGGKDLEGGGCLYDPTLAGRMRFEVHSIRPARRVAPDGSFLTDLVVLLTQRRCAPLDPNAPSPSPGLWLRGGCTLIIDTRRGQERVRYCISKRIDSAKRLDRQRDHTIESARSLRALYFGAAMGEPFAALHRGH
jgi:hypothetical protein